MKSLPPKQFAFLFVFRFVLSHCGTCIFRKVYWCPLPVCVLFCLVLVLLRLTCSFDKLLCRKVLSCNQWGYPLNATSNCWVSLLLLGCCPLLGLLGKACCSKIPWGLLEWMVTTVWLGLVSLTPLVRGVLSFLDCGCFTAKDYLISCKSTRG